MQLRRHWFILGALLLVFGSCFAADHFVDNKNGTVTDTKTGLMWAAKDNGSNITWDDAKKYCENYRGAGYSDWRMPTLDELPSLYDGYSGGQISDCAPTAGVIFVVKEIKLSCYNVWADRKGPSPSAAQTDPMFYLGFNGQAHFAIHGYSGNDISTNGIRALPVRTVKKK